MSTLCEENFKRFKWITFIVINLYGAFLFAISLMLNPLTIKIALMIYGIMLVVVMPSIFLIKLGLLKTSKDYVKYIEKRELKRTGKTKEELKVDSTGTIHRSHAKDDELMKKLLLLNEKENKRARN